MVLRQRTNGGYLTSESDFEPKLDLLESRRQLIAMRTQHAQNRSVTRRINRLLVELAYLCEPCDRVQEKRLMRMFDNTIRVVERIASKN